MLKLGMKIVWYNNTAIVLLVDGNDVLIKKDGVNQTNWVKMDLIKVFNKI